MPSSLDDAVDDAFLGDYAAIEANANRFFGDGGDPGFLLIAIIRRALMFASIAA